MRGTSRFSFTSLDPNAWLGYPTQENLCEEIAQAVLAHSEVLEKPLGFYVPPDEIREVRITVAALDQIRCMWHGHRKAGHQSPPVIPLSFFVYSFGQENGKSYACIEILPGLEAWGDAD